MIDVLLLFFVVILSAFVFGEIFFRFHLSRAMGQIVAGLILGMPFFSGFISPEGNSMILLLSEVGIIFLLILTGLEIDLKKIKMDSRLHGNDKRSLIKSLTAIKISRKRSFQYE